MRIASVLVLATLFVYPACKKKEPAAETKEEKAKPVYVFPKLKPGKKDGGHEIRCNGDLCDKGTQLPLTPEGVLSVKITDCEGCSLTIAGKTIEVEDDKSVKIDLLNALGDADPKSVDSISDLVLPVTVAPAKGTAENPDQKIELLGSVVAAVILNRVTKGPLAFKKDKQIDEPRAAIIVRSDPRYGTVTRVGDAKRVRDYDLIGVADSTDKDLGSCGLYKKEGSDEKVEVKMKGTSLDITMYDRRTGKSLGKKSFPPKKPDCHSELVAGTSYVLGRPSNDDIGEWAKGFFK